MANFGLYGVPKLMLKKVSKTYASARGRTDALHQIDLSVKSGEFICIVGPSGCGKSTLLKLIAGLDAHTGGEILADGRRVSGPGTDRLLLFQEPALFPWLNVLHNVEFGLKMAGIPEKERREKALGVLELVNLLKFCNAYVHELSGGMKQKVALARALVMDPQMLLMDEPFAALDAQTRATLHEELQQAWLATKKTIIFVTHNIEEAVRLADRVIVFSNRPGRICREIPVNMARPRGSYNYAGIAALIEEIAAELKSGPPEALSDAFPESFPDARPDARPDTPSDASPETRPGALSKLASLDLTKQNAAKEELPGEGYSQKVSVSYTAHSSVAGRFKS